MILFDGSLDELMLQGGDEEGSTSVETGYLSVVNRGPATGQHD
jgi:hypothetical protein